MAGHNPQALIGYSGFVGNNILAQQPFEYLYNSTNIDTIQNKNFDLVVCAGAPGVKWLANKEPGADLASINKLINNLKYIKTKKFILISTVDVYPRVSGVNEDSTIAINDLLPYGKHRRLLEEFVADHFDALIVRLPGIFGKGLKKNPLYDLIQNFFTYINPASMLQFFPLDYLWTNIEKSLANNLSLINFATVPISLEEIARTVFNIECPSVTDGTPAHYDIHTKYASLWGNKEPYLYLKDTVINSIKLFVSTFKK